MANTKKCIDNSNYEGELELDRIYKVEDIPGHPDYYSIDIGNRRGRKGFRKDRFVDDEADPNTIIKKVRCINADASEGRLTVGHIYCVIVANRLEYQLYAVTPNFPYWRHERFVDCDAELSERPTLPILPDVKDDPSIDHQEERCRAILTGPRPGNCACDVLIEMCWIHRP